jgi:hypothetical protein
MLISFSLDTLSASEEVIQGIPLLIDFLVRYISKYDEAVS